MYVGMYVCMYVYMYVCTHTRINSYYVYADIYIPTYTSNPIGCVLYISCRVDASRNLGQKGNQFAGLFWNP